MCNTVCQNSESHKGIRHFFDVNSIQTVQGKKMALQNILLVITIQKILSDE